MNRRLLLLLSTIAVLSTSINLYAKSDGDWYSKCNKNENGLDSCFIMHTSTRLIFIFEHPGWATPFVTVHDSIGIPIDKCTVQFGYSKIYRSSDAFYDCYFEYYESRALLHALTAYESNDTLEIKIIETNTGRHFKWKGSAQGFNNLYSEIYNVNGRHEAAMEEYEKLLKSGHLNPPD